MFFGSSSRSGYVQPAFSSRRALIVRKTGFSQGVPNITNDDELAAQVAGFLEQFLEVFAELKGSNFYVSGESVSLQDVP